MQQQQAPVIIPARVEPLRQYGIGPLLLTLYLFSLVILQFLLVSLGVKPSLRTC
jgi:hypothetical protein